MSTSILSPAEVLSTFRIEQNVYLLGSLERGLTVHSQQMRAHNLAWALWEAGKSGAHLRHVGVIGGGISGITLTTALMSILPDTRVTLIERLWDICAFQQGCDSRWLHPNIYNWPRPGSRAPSASLPLLDWPEGRAADVVRKLVAEFARCCDAFDPQGSKLEIFLGSANVNVKVAEQQISWEGAKSERSGIHFKSASPQHYVRTFDAIIVATGFGIEKFEDEFPKRPYWRNDELGQLRMDGRSTPYLIAGYGDGAIVDLCRCRIAHFRQDTILDDLFGKKLDQYEEEIDSGWARLKDRLSHVEYFEKLLENQLRESLTVIQASLRKDTSAFFYIRGRTGKSQIEQVIGAKSSFLNSMLLFLLWKASAFNLVTENFNMAIKENSIDHDNVIIRYGPRAKDFLKASFADFDKYRARFDDLADHDHQEAKQYWEPGCFRIP